MIREMRKSAGMTLKEFSQFTGVPLRTIQNWEAGPETKSCRKCPEYIVSMIQYKLEHEGKIKTR